MLPVPAGLSTLSALTAYDEHSAKFITDAKYHNSRTGLVVLARWAARMVPGDVVDELGCVSWAPTATRRRRERGFDQAQIMARIVGRELGLPTRRLLRRSSAAAQTGRTRTERLSGPVFTPLRDRGSDSHRRLTTPSSILIVDDVCTTGATLIAAARALAGSGRAVHGLVIARTPAPGA
ncbi:MAG: hypothetical protein F2520_05900 [Actinobacteria bacterium]|uniref:Unannotated protein n=1 Tax=freshwater metagenome TaxID=449393 RepID=A0A6J7I4P7_9ZZZZ|nr:hypothetical protein [Actinomycetota bacterium]MTA77775.1 hypothetical protein [Actinomycetota bacterium]